MFMRLSHSGIKRVLSKNRVNSSFSSRSISNNSNSLFFNKNFSLEDKINSALAQGYPEDAQTAFFQGIGFERLGEEYKNHALSAFERAIELSNEDICLFSSKEHIARIKNNSYGEEVENEQRFRAFHVQN